ncbi:MAG: hypothetical protein A2V70_08325 [Planctomycetes bacterium RBG_13_63_9]|nr:MAG: hypothetical protein A2V70_08325 [Planctomycetes bacterium RBG_13_63_9]
MNKRIGVQVSPTDNVVTVVEDAQPGDEIQYVTPEGCRQITASQAVPLGHKAALKDVRPKEKIIKYGQTIGTASRMIGQGEHVHIHNVHSAVQGGRSAS